MVSISNTSVRLLADSQEYGVNLRDEIIYINVPVL
jgi:hypothetical protein